MVVTAVVTSRCVTEQFWQKPRNSVNRNFQPKRRLISRRRAISAPISYFVRRQILLLRLVYAVRTLCSLFPLAGVWPGMDRIA